MKIAIEALGIHVFGGGRTATLTLLEGLLALDEKNQYRIFLTQSEPTLSNTAGNVKQVIAPFKNRFLQRLWAQAVLPWAVQDCHLLHYAKNLGVFCTRKPEVVTMYDMTTLVHPELFPWMDVWYWRHVQKLTLHKAARIISISETTAHDIARFYALHPEKIRVIYPSIDPRFQPATSDEIERVRKIYGLPDTFVLHVGRIDRKKNLTLLVEALAQARQLIGPGFADHLVLVGDMAKKSQDEDLLPFITSLGLKEYVVFTGCIPDTDLPAVYSAARLAVSASLHEGFGLSAMEALGCGVPLLAYQAAALQEAVGDAAVVLDTLNCGIWAETLARLLSEDDFRQQLSEKGLARAQLFQRERNARETLKLYQEVAKNEI